MGRIVDLISEREGLFAAWLVKNGQVFTPVSETKSYSGYEQTIKSCKRKRCFTNSIESAVTHNMDYYEGFYLFKEADKVILPHAFNVKDGVLYDFTSKRFRYKPAEWFGVKIPLECLAELLERIADKKMEDTNVLFEYWSMETFGVVERLLEYLATGKETNPLSETINN